MLNVLKMATLNANRGGDNEISKKVKETMDKAISV